MPAWLQRLLSNRTCGFPASGLPRVLRAWRARVAHGTTQTIQAHRLVTVAGPLVVTVACSLAAPPPVPAPEPLIHILVQRVELPVSIARPEIIAPPPEHRVERRNHLNHVARDGAIVGQLMNPGTEFLHRLRRRPSLHIMPPGHPLDAPTLANGATEKREARLALPQ